MVYLVRLSVGPLSPFLRDAFDLSNAQIGGLISATALTYAPTLIVAGWLADRIGVRRVLVGGSAFAARLRAGDDLRAVVRGASRAARPVEPRQPAASTRRRCAPSCCGSRCASGRRRSASTRRRSTSAGCSARRRCRRWPPRAAGAPASSPWGCSAWSSRSSPSSATATLRRGGDGRAKPWSLATARASSAGGGAPASVRRRHDDAPVDALACCARATSWLLMLFGLFLGVVEYSALTQLVLYLEDVYLLGAVAAGGDAGALPGGRGARQAAQRAGERPRLRRPPARRAAALPG